MIGKKIKQFLTFVLVGSMLFGSIPVSANTVADDAAQEEIMQVAEVLTVSFDNAYAEVGKELSVTVEGAAAEVTYEWSVAGVKLPDHTTNSYTPTTEDLESWIEVVVSDGSNSASAKMYFSKLPVVYIDTQGAEIKDKINYVDATMKIQGNTEYDQDNYEDPILYDGDIEIRGRGNSTWGLPKKPYKIKLGTKTSIFNMGKNKHWVLLANYLDESLMRNTLAYDFSGDLGLENMSTVWVDVILNGKYVGNYQFCEQVRVGETRVDVFDWEGFAEDAAGIIAETVKPYDEETDTKEVIEEAKKFADDLETYMVETDMSWITSGKVEFNGTIYELSKYEKDLLKKLKKSYGTTLNSIDELSSLITGGYILELDEYYDEVSKFKTSSGQPMMFKNPEFVDTNSDMMAYVQNYVQAFEDAVQADDYTVEYQDTVSKEIKNVHYTDLYDFDALIDYWLVTEVFFNEEMNKKSTYMYKDVDGLMTMGPIWDMDWSSNGEGSTWYTDRWATDFFSRNAQANQWYKYLVQDPYFLMKVQERYWEIRNVQLQDMLDVIDDHYELLVESGEADGIRWHSKNSFASDAEKLETWLKEHVAWMDTQMATEDSLVGSFSSLYKPTSSLTLTLTAEDGSALGTDDETYAPADAVADTATDLVLTISDKNGLSDKAKIFINSKEVIDSVSLSGTEVTYIIKAAVLEGAETKNVIEVKVLDSSNNVTASNFVTVKQIDCEHTYGDTWKTDAERHWKECANEGCEKKSGLAKHNFEWKIDKAATELSNGVKHEECTVCGYTRNNNTEFEYVEVPMNPSDDSRDISVENMIAISDTEHPETTLSTGGKEGLDDYILDNDYGTIWHTNHESGKEPAGADIKNRWVGVKFSEPTAIGGIRYLSRTDGKNGTVMEYEVQYRETDEGEWITVASGSDEDYADNSWNLITFENVTAKQVRIVGVKTYYSDTINYPDGKHMSMAEFRVLTAKETVVPETIDKSKLEESINAAEELDENKYTEESMKALIEALEKAQDVLENDTAAQEEIDEAAEALVKAMEALVPVGNPDPENPDPELPAPDEFEVQGVTRLAGAGRIDTGFKVADTYKAVLGVDQFETVIIATGSGFADALTGSYLAYVKNAPIILTSDARMKDVADYVKANLTANGKVYILGGREAVKETLDTELKDAGYDVERLAGANRYETNLLILQAANVTGGEMIIATGKTFADSLSASAVKKPILLVKDSLSDVQTAYLADLNVEKIYIVGGVAAVVPAVEEQLKATGTAVERIAGENRQETSVKIAKTFFADPTAAVLAYAKNFPDGLCGGPLAAELNIPLLLTQAGKTDDAKAYVEKADINAGYVLGGDAVLADDVVVKIFALKSAEEII